MYLFGLGCNRCYLNGRRVVLKVEAEAEAEAACLVLCDYAVQSKIELQEYSKRSLGEASKKGKGETTGRSLVWIHTTQCCTRWAYVWAYVWAKARAMA